MRAGPDGGGAVPPAEPVAPAGMEDRPGADPGLWGNPGPWLRRTTIAALTLIWGTTWAAIRIGLGSIPPLTGLALRFALAAVLLLGLAFSLGLSLRPTPRRRTLWLVHGLLSFCVAYVVTYWCEQWIPSGLAAVLFATFPLFVALLAHRWIPGEALTPGTAVGTVGGFVGVAVIFSEDAAVLGGPDALLAAGIMLLSPLAAAVANVTVKRLGRDVHPVTLNTGGMVLAAGVVGILAALFERDREVAFDAAGVGSVLYLAVFGSATAFVLYFWLLHHIPASKLALMALVVPVIAVLIGAIVFDEPITARVLTGTALVVGGVGLASASRSAA